MTMSINPTLALDVSPAGAGAGSTDHTVTRPFVIYDVVVLPSATQAGGTAQLLREPAAGGGFVAVTDAIACAAPNTVGRVATLTKAQSSFATGDILRLTLAGAITDGDVRVSTWPTPIAGAT